MDSGLPGGVTRADHIDLLAGHRRPEGVLRADLLGQRCGRLLPQVRDDHCTALGGDPPHNGLTDALCRRRDERDLALESPHHHSSRIFAAILPAIQPELGGTETAAEHDQTIARDRPVHHTQTNPATRAVTLLGMTDTRPLALRPASEVIALR